MCAKELDKTACLKPWKNASTSKNLNGYEINLITGDEINDYVDIPDMNINLINRKLYYQNGMRIKKNKNESI